MRQSYDATAGALYITLRDGEAARTREVAGGTNADLDADGRVLGIEILSPGRPWPLQVILREHEISDEDAHSLMMAYPGGTMLAAGR